MKAETLVPLLAVAAIAILGYRFVAGLAGMFPTIPSTGEVATGIVSASDPGNFFSGLLGSNSPGASVIDQTLAPLNPVAAIIGAADGLRTVASDLFSGFTSLNAGQASMISGSDVIDPAG